MYLFTICTSRDTDYEYVSEYPHGNQQPTAILRLRGFWYLSEMQCINLFIQSKIKVGLHILDNHDNHSPWTSLFYQWKLYVIKLVSIY